MNIYALITPIVLLLLIAEVIYCRIKNNGIYPYQDSVANIATAIGNQCIGLAVAYYVYHVYGWINQFAPYHFSNAWYNYVILLIISDFVFYWFHRAGHSINIFWAAHSPHHSSEEYNLSVGLRASFTQRIFQFVFFDWILALIGFSPDMIYSVAAVHLLLAYWHHTQLIDKMGWIEKVFVTPSAHRVHHGVNNQYLDRNFAEFLVWDKLFGTFEPEVEPVCYGVTKPIQSWNPYTINLQFWKQLWSDAKETKYFADKIKIWFMPLGWRPRDVEPYPAKMGYTREEQVKYESKEFPKSRIYLILQIVFGMLFMYFAIDQKNSLDFTQRLIMCTALFIMILSWSGLLEAKKWAPFLEVFRLLVMGSIFIWILNVLNIVTTFWNVYTALVFLVVGVSIIWCLGNFRKMEVVQLQ